MGMRKRKRTRDVETNTPPSRSIRIRRALVGFVVGFLFWLAFAGFFLQGITPHVAEDWTFPLVGLIFAGIAVTRFRRLIWVAAGLLVLGFFVLGYTPVVSWMIKGWVRSDALRNAQAVVVLAADSDDGLDISEKGQARILHGYEVAHQGFAPLLVVSRGSPRNPSWVPAIKKQMDRLGIDVPIEETSEVTNTHDEALAVAKTARTRGWRDVILVTHPIHMRRSVGVFEKAGLHVIASPCVEWRYNIDDLSNMPARLTALREWLHEWLGCWAYRRRGWME